ncbi:MAG: class I SAM-dependent methyltransferase [Propionibacteriaceae bacterium]|nr:class I SAM-dependent methyltransferase [Propionibacteriaceae bacterium]
MPFIKQHRRADLGKNAADVESMFSAVAPRYDLMNDIASLGQDRRWRSAVVSALAPQSGEVILDLAAGTGTSSQAIAKTKAKVVATDLTYGMVRLGHLRYPDQCFVVGDALHLPYADAAFDAATMSFGLRNVARPEVALRELHRVVRPGGTLVICEFSRPTTAMTRSLYRFWLRGVMPVVAKVVSTDDEAYAYLGESIISWPDQRGLAAMMEQAGWDSIQWRNLTGGIVALHRAIRP